MNAISCMLLERKDDGVVAKRSTERKGNIEEAKGDEVCKKTSLAVKAAGQRNVL